MTPYQFLQLSWKFLTHYISYSMIAIGNAGTIVIIATTGITNSIISLLFWVILFDIGTIALTLWYWKNPVPLKKSAK